MSAIFRKTKTGLEVLAIHDGAPILIDQTFRMVNGMRLDILHWLDMEALDAWWAIRNPVLQMTMNNEDAYSFGFQHRNQWDEGHEEDEDYDEPASCFVRYEGIVLMRARDIQYHTSPPAYLLDLEGYVLAGSNVYNDGKLCLGDSVNALSVQPVEALIHNEANTDLYWHGDYLIGEWASGEGDEQESYFNIETWPTASHHCSPPQGILDDISRLWPT